MKARDRETRPSGEISNGTGDPGKGPRKEKRGVLSALGSLNTPRLVPYLFIVPFFLVFAGFLLYPMAYALILSFSEWSTSGLTFVGLTNYKDLFLDPLFRKSLYNTGIILAVQVPVMLFLGTVIAVQLNADRLRFRGLFRLAIFFPVLIDLVTYSLVFSLLFLERGGLINQALGLFGIDPIAWRTDGLWAKVMIIAAITWRWTGYNAIIILSGLQSISKDLYEAARIDGAGKVTTFLNITVPLLKPVLLFCAIISTIGTIQLFNEPYVLTRGGPNNETLTALYYLYERGFGSFNFGLAAAGTYVLTTIMAVFSYIQIRAARGGEV